MDFVFATKNMLKKPDTASVNIVENGLLAGGSILILATMCLSAINVLKTNTLLSVNLVAESSLKIMP